MKTNAQSTEAPTSTAIANTEDGIEDGDVSAEPPPEDNTVNPAESSNKNRWEELPKIWRFHKNKRSRVMINPYSGGYGAGKGPPKGSLTGARHTQATCHTDTGDITIDIKDRFDKARSYDKDLKFDWILLHSELWTGVIDFEKVLPNESRTSNSDRGGSTP